MPGRWTQPTVIVSSTLLTVGLAPFAPVSPAPGVGAPPASVARVLPDRIELPDQVRQLVTITSASFGDTTATLRAWRRDTSGSWERVRKPFKVVLGYNGWVKGPKRVQATGTTPAGEYAMPYAFGRRPDPGANLDYRRVDGNDWWPYDRRDPATYNVYQRHKAPGTHWRSGRAERLDSYTKQYGYAIVVGFNLPSGVHYSPRRDQWVASQRADTRAGGGIFLHVKGDGATAGCVAMARKNIRWLVRWVRPDAQPRVVMGPTKYVVKL